MSEPSAPTDQTAEALTRLANYGDKKKRPGGGWGPLVLILVLAIPLVAVGWVAWQQRTLQDELAALRADNAALQARSATGADQVEQAQQQLQDAQRQLAEAQQQRQEQDATVQQTLEQRLAESTAAVALQSERLAAQSAQLATLEAELAQTRSRLNALGTGGAPLAEAEVLLRFAQQRLALARDVTTAIELFNAADALLRDMGDPALAAVRASLVREVAALQAVPVVDVPGLFARLGAESARVEHLAVISSATVQDFNVTPVAGEVPQDSAWWTRAKQALGEYFVVTHDAGPAVPQLSGRDQFQLRALVQLHIEQARLALLRGDAPLYEAALDDALATGRRWLRSDDASFDEFMASLQMLRATPIAVDIPAADETLAALRRVSGANAAPPAATENPSEGAVQ